MDQKNAVMSHPAPGSAPAQPEAPREPTLVVRGAADLLTTLARCCKPIRGDDVVGFISRGRGLVIHRADCPNVSRLKYNPDRFMEVRWSEKETSSAGHEVHLAIQTEDKTGMVAAITQIVADAKAPLRHLEASVNDRGEGVIRLAVLIRDKSHLSAIQTRIARIPGVLGLRRVNR